MRTIEVNVFTYNELNEYAKQNARDQLVSEYFWSDDAINSLNAFADEIGITIDNYRIDWWSASHSTVHWRGTPSTKYIKEDLTGYCMDYPLTKTFNKTKDVDEAIYAWLRECCNDFEHQQTDEYMIEHCEANRYEFDEQGNLI